MIGHITQHELRRHATSLELANGFMNRVLFICCRRQRLLPEGGNPDPLHNTGLDRLLAAAVKQARTAGNVRLDPDARELWHHAYRRLAAEPHDQLLAQITARAEAHVYLGAPSGCHRCHRTPGNGWHAKRYLECVIDVICVVGWPHLPSPPPSPPSDSPARQHG